MARYNENAPYQQSRAALRQIYGSRSINASAPNVSPPLTGAPGPSGGMGKGLTPESEWRRFFGAKPDYGNASTGAAGAGAPMLWNKMRENLTNKPISDQAWAKIREDTNPMRNIVPPVQGQTTPQLAPDDAPDVNSVASFYQPPPQLGGPRSLLMDPQGYGSLDNTPSTLGGSSAFFKKYGRMRDLTGLGQDNFML